MSKVKQSQLNALRETALGGMRDQLVQLSQARRGVLSKAKIETLMAGAADGWMNCIIALKQAGLIEIDNG